MNQALGYTALVLLAIGFAAAAMNKPLAWAWIASSVACWALINYLTNDEG